MDPAEKTTQRSPDGIVIGIVSVSPQPKVGNPEKYLFFEFFQKNFAEDGLHMVVAEGGAGRFVLRNGTAQLLYRGPIGQFPHDYALKVRNFGWIFKKNRKKLVLGCRIPKIFRKTPFFA